LIATLRTIASIWKNEYQNRNALEIARQGGDLYDKFVGFVEDLKTVVSEAAINAMQHGNKERPDAVVTIHINFKEDAIQILVMDEGDGIKEVLPKPNIERIINELDPPIGFGVFLIQELTDEVEFNIDNNKGHCLRMVVKK